MIPILLPALERHGRLKLGAADRVLVLAISAATIDRLLADTKIAAAGGKRRRVGFYSAIRREVPIRTFNDWADPPPGFCEIDMVAHGGTSVAGSFIQTLTMVDVATGWTECLPLVMREGSLVVEAIKRAQSLFPWIILGADFDNDSAFMNDVVVPWCRAQKIEVTRSRAYKKNDQAFVEQKNGAVVRRLMGYGLFDGIETAQVMARLYAAARLHVNFFQPSFKLKEKRREGAKVIKRYHAPATPYERALAPARVEKDQAAVARAVSHARSGGAALRDPRSSRRTGSADRPARPCCRFANAIADIQHHRLCADARHVDQSRRDARHAPTRKGEIQDAGPHAIEARSTSGNDRRLARGRAAAHGPCDCRKACTARRRSVRAKAAFYRAAAPEGAPQKGGGAAHRRRDHRRCRGPKVRRRSWQDCGRAAPSLRHARTGKSRCDAQSISARRGTGPVTFLHEAIRGVNFASRLTPMGRPLSVDECARLLRLAGEEHMRLLLLFLMATAARPSSILELDWSQMDYEHGLIHLNKPGRVQTKKVRPIVKMPIALSELHGSGLVICWKGKPVARPMTAWRKLRKRAGLVPDVTLYSFRHTLGRWMRAQGVSDGEIGLQLGHRKLGVTERYAPYGPDYLTGAVAAINRFLDVVLRSKSVAAQLQKPPSGGRSSVVEHQLPKLSVEGSIPFARSNVSNQIRH